MASKDSQLLATLLTRHESDLLKDWLAEMERNVRRTDLMDESELREQCEEFLRGVRQAASSGNLTDISTGAWAEVRDFLTGISASRAHQGFSPSETAGFVFSFRRPLFALLRREIKKADELADETWCASQLLDQLGLLTTEMYQRSREEIIARQQEEMLELSTPVVKLWDGVLALPLIGTLDSNRTQVVMESLLQRIVDTNSEVAIIDITGVPTVDTLVAQHLMKTVSAAKLMGVECIISGIRPQIAQTIVHLGVALGDIVTKASLADAFRIALKRVGTTIHTSRDAAR